MFIERFFNYLSYEKRYSSHTITSYRTDISQYLSFLETQQLSYLEVTHHDIRSWVITNLNNGLDARSVNRKISTLKSLYKFLIKEEALKLNPTSKLILPKVAKKLPVFIEEDKLNSLLDSSVFEDDFYGQRDKLVMELLFSTGIRLSELVGIKISDIDQENLQIKVLGKRNKERILPLTKTVNLLIDNYLYLKKELLDIDINDFLIVTNGGLKIYSKFVYRIVQKYLNLVTTKEKKSPHIIRHSFATALLNNGADINAIKELLGHESLSATQVYTHNSIERIKLIYKQAHPKA